MLKAFLERRQTRTATSALIVFIVGGLGFLGYREVQGAMRPLRERQQEMEREQQSIIDGLKDAQDKYSALTGDLEKLKKEAHANLRAAVYVSAATTYLTAGGTELNLRRAARDATSLLFRRPAEALPVSRAILVGRDACLLPTTPHRVKTL